MYFRDSVQTDNISFRLKREKYGKGKYCQVFTRDIRLLMRPNQLDHKSSVIQGNELEQSNISMWRITIRLDRNLSMHKLNFYQHHLADYRYPFVCL